MKTRFVCKNCGQNPIEAAYRGAYLNRVSKKGIVPAVWECVPSCKHTMGDQESALIAAIAGKEETK